MMLNRKLLPLLLIVGLVLSSCSASDSAFVTLTNNISGPAGADGTNGTNGTDGQNGTNGTNGVNGTFTQNQSGVHLTSPYFWGNVTVGSKILSAGEVGLFTLDSVTYQSFRAGNIYSQAGYNIVNGGAINAVNSPNAYYVFQGYSNGTYAEIARLQGGNSTTKGYVQFTAKPKFSETSVSGPANNTTIVGWVPIIYGTANETLYMPVYR